MVGVAQAQAVNGNRHRLQMGRAEGIEVATEDKAAWDAAVAAFKKAHGPGIARQTFSSLGGVMLEPVQVLGAGEFGLDGSRAILT